MMEDMNKVQQVKGREEDQMMKEMNKVQQVNIFHKVVLAHRMNTRFIIRFMLKKCFMRRRI